MAKTLALVSNNSEIVSGFRSIFSSSYRLKVFTCFVELVVFLRTQVPDCILIDFCLEKLLPPECDICVLKKRCPVFVIAPRAVLENAEESEAKHIFSFPEDIPLLLNGDIADVAQNTIPFPDDFAGVSEKAAEIKKKVLMASQTDMPVLITGETGSGKGLVAELIHKLSARKDHEMKRLNVTTIPAELSEGMLFGTVKGAFTDAVTQEGYFEIARKTTLFLDEIGDLKPNIQAKLLHVIEDGTFQSVGSRVEKSSDARLIFATNADLKAKMFRGEFRADFYYRISHFLIHIPPLRERKEDIIPIARKFLASSGKRLTSSAEMLLTTLEWRGNVRQLYNCLERAIIFSGSGPIDANHIVVE